MGILDFFFSRKDAATTAGIAKERLQIVLAHERAGREAPDFLPALQRELLEVVGRYVAVKDDLIRVNLAKQSAASVLEINIEFDSAKPVEKPAEKLLEKPGQTADRTAKAPQPRSKSAGKRR